MEWGTGVSQGVIKWGLGRFERHKRGVPGSGASIRPDLVGEERRFHSTSSSVSAAPHKNFMCSCSSDSCTNHSFDGTLCTFFILIGDVANDDSSSGSFKETSTIL